MQQNRHIVTTPDGQTIIRNSQTRTYTHCVVGKRNEAAALTRASRVFDKTERSNYRFFSTHVEGRNYGPTQAKAAAFLAEYPTYEDYRTAQIDEQLMRHHRAVAAGKFQDWVVFGFNGRLDLAQKLAAKKRGEGYLEVTILPVTMVRR